MSKPYAGHMFVNDAAFYNIRSQRENPILIPLDDYRLKICSTFMVTASLLSVETLSRAESPSVDDFRLMNVNDSRSESECTHSDEETAYVEFTEKERRDAGEFYYRRMRFRGLYRGRIPPNMR